MAGDAGSVGDRERLTGFQSWFLDSCPEELTAEISKFGAQASVRISSERQPRHASLVVAATDDATRAVFDALPTLAENIDTLDIVCDGRAWSMGSSPLLVPHIERTEGTDPTSLRLATTRSVLYPEELPYPLPLLAQETKTSGGTVRLRLWLCLRWDSDVLAAVRTTKAGAAQRSWLAAVAAHPQVSRLLHVRAVDLAGNVTLNATTTFPARSWAEALWGVR